MDVAVRTADDERLCVVKLLSGVREEITGRIILLTWLAGVARIDESEYLDIGKSVEGLGPQTLDTGIHLPETIDGVEQRTVIFTDVTEPEAVNVDGHATKASPLRTGRLVIRLNREV